MQFRTFSCFFVNLGLSVQTELEPSPAAPSHQNYRFLGLPGPTEQMQPYHLLDLSYRFPGQQRNHAALQLPECTYLLLPAKLTVTLNLLALLHLKYAATQHFRLSQSLISWLFLPQHCLDATVQEDSGLLKTQPLFWSVKWQGCAFRLPAENSHG